MNITTKTKRALLVVYGICVVGISVYALIFFLRYKVYLIGSDTFYYMSIADSIRQSRVVMDITSIPAQPLKTTQNGIVLFHIVLSALGLGPESRLVSIVVINYLLHLSAIYPLYKIARRVGLEGDFPMAALLGVHVGAWHVYRLQLLPNNDGVFNALSIWLTYLIIVVLQYDSEPKIPERFTRLNRWRLALALTIALSAVLVHFRVQTLLVLGAALLTAIVVRQYRSAIWSVGFLSVATASVVLPYAFADTSLISAQNDRFWNDFFIRLPSNIIGLGDRVIPNLLFTDAGLRANLMYGTFALALLLALISGLRKRVAGVLLISLSCTAAILFVTVLYFQTHRLLVYIFPFLYLLILLPTQTRSIGYMFVALVLTSSLITFASGFQERGPESRFWLYLNEQHVTLPNADPLLVSESPRHTYFLLGARAFRGELTLDLITAHEGLFLVGYDEFISAHLTEIESMAEAAGFTFQRQSLTPGYQNEEGWELLQLYDFAQVEHR